MRMVGIGQMINPGWLMKAVVLGGSGETGQSLLGLLSTEYTQCNVTCISRRPLPPHHTIQYHDLNSATAADFTDTSIVFCAIGTTKAAAGSSAAFAAVDHDLVLHLATQAKHAGVTSFHLVSSVGADPHSWWLYPQTKGRVEESLRAVGFDRLVIYRPALLLLGEGRGRRERRVLEAVGRWVAPAVEWMFPGRFAISCDDLARAMLTLGLDGGTGDTDVTNGTDVTVLENYDIYKIARKL